MRWHTDACRCRRYHACLFTTQQHSPLQSHTPPGSQREYHHHRRPLLLYELVAGYTESDTHCTRSLLPPSAKIGARHTHQALPDDDAELDDMFAAISGADF